MMEDNKESLPIQAEIIEENKQICELNTATLDAETLDTAQQIIDEQDMDKLKDLTHLFNMHQAKKNVVRMTKLNELQDKVTDQMIKRFEERPDEFSNADLLDYAQVIQNNIEKTTKAIGMVDEAPLISITQNTMNINTAPQELFDRESKERISDAISAILAQAKQLTENNEQENGGNEDGRDE